MASDEGPRIVQLPKANELEAAIGGIKRSLPQLLEYQGLLAQITKARYDALVKVGFTTSQALTLCQGNPIT